MKKKKAKTILRVVIICLFVALIATTAGVTLHAAIESYRYDMDPANGIDIFEGFAAVLLAMFGGFIVVCELDLFFVLFYALTQKKTVAKTVMNTVCPLCLFVVYALVAWNQTILRFLPEEIGALLVVLLCCLHGLLRLSYVVLCLADDPRKMPHTIPEGD